MKTNQAIAATRREIKRVLRNVEKFGEGWIVDLIDVETRLENLLRQQMGIVKKIKQAYNLTAYGKCAPWNRNVGMPENMDRFIKHYSPDKLREWRRIADKDWNHVTQFMEEILFDGRWTIDDFIASKNQHPIPNR